MEFNDLDKALTKKLLKRIRSSWHELRYDEIRNKAYLVGRQQVSEEMKAISVVSGSRIMKFRDLKHIVSDSGQSSTILAISSDDSTNVFYKCQMGLQSPITGSAVLVNNNSSEEDSEN